MRSGNIKGKLQAWDGVIVEGYILQRGHVAKRANGAGRKLQALAGELDADDDALWIADHAIKAVVGDIYVLWRIQWVTEVRVVGGLIVGTAGRVAVQAPALPIVRSGHLLRRR